MMRPQVVVLALALSLLLGCSGVAGAWLLRRRSSLSIRNLYPVAVLAIAAVATAVASGWWPAVIVLVPLSAPVLAGAGVGWRWRSADLGAGEELRNHELSRRWIWQPAPDRSAGERVYLRGQGELVHERSWPTGVRYVSMTAAWEHGPRLPLGDGQHIVLFGATGAGKTTTARRLVAARTLAEHAALLVLDQKGDEEDVAQMQLLAARAGVRSCCSTPRTRKQTAGNRSGAPRTASPHAAWSRFDSLSPTTTTRCAGTWTSSARCYTAPDTGHRPYRS